MRASELQCLKVARTAGQFLRLLDPGVYIQLKDVITRFRLRINCLLEHKCLLELETHVLCYYLFPRSAACCCHSYIGIELTPTIEDSYKEVADGGQ